MVCSRWHKVFGIEYQLYRHIICITWYIISEDPTNPTLCVCRRRHGWERCSSVRICLIEIKHSKPLIDKPAFWRLAWWKLSGLEITWEGASQTKHGSLHSVSIFDLAVEWTSAGSLPCSPCRVPAQSGNIPFSKPLLAQSSSFVQLQMIFPSSILSLLFGVSSALYR